MNLLETKTANWTLDKLSEDTMIVSFESTDEELNDFLLNDAKKYLNSLLAITYLIRSHGEIVAYFCLSNDRVTKDEEEKSIWNKINRTIDNEKRRKSYPAVKIGRLAVAKKYAGLGFGSTMITAVVNMFIDREVQSGCRFITVDAYNNALPFYEKNKFKYLTDKDKSGETRAMYFDLKAVN
ncbi:N-acetyltransferase [Bacteroidia bacterium]|nr:N-acetyltransferase [Bacteroidia bacterium]